MKAEVEFSDEFEDWWNGLSVDEQESVAHSVGLLHEFGPSLGRPHVDVVHQSKFRNMKELRVQHHGRPIRVLFAFDPKRDAYLILGGDKTGNDRWYEEMVPIADGIYQRYLSELSEHNLNS